MRFDLAVVNIIMGRGQFWLWCACDGRGAAARWARDGRCAGLLHSRGPRGAPRPRDSDLCARAVSERRRDGGALIRCVARQDGRRPGAERPRERSAVCQPPPPSSGVRDRRPEAERSRLISRADFSLTRAQGMQYTFRFLGL